MRNATESRRAGGAVALVEDARAELTAAGDALPELSVMASGNLGLIDLPARAGARHARAMEQLYPRLLPALLAHPGIAFVLVRGERGPVALGQHGAHWVAEGRIEGDDPLARSARTPPRTCCAPTATPTARTSS